MYRYLIHTRGFSLPSYGVMMVIAYFAGLYVILREARRVKLDASKLESLTLWILVGMIIGARVWYVIEMWNYYSQNVGAIFRVWEGGLVFYGGFIGGFVGGLLYLKVSKLQFGKVTDVFAPGLALAIGIGRIGCFLNGCCFGKVTSSWIGVEFPRRWNPPVYETHLRNGWIQPGASHSLPVIPTQIISAIDLLLIFGVLLFLRKRKPFDGFLFYLFLGLYGLHRFIIDFFRYYEGNALILKYITLSQAFSIVLMIISVVFIIRGLKTRISG
ncbi:prolipoprotein diacylglyceryl transferase [bacterium]|nr:MAG: prolipoprotein diacylglyceryl transferase [bacterium]RKZ23409.1 MAG: prolipoprotein diacylglyceryl transferase [bacterium]